MGQLLVSVVSSCLLLQLMVVGRDASPLLKDLKPFSHLRLDPEVDYTPVSRASLI